MEGRQPRLYSQTYECFPCNHSLRALSKQPKTGSAPDKFGDFVDSAFH
jgi:hypothetical protein